MLYKVFFVSGSTDILEANSAAEARDAATKDFGRVRRVKVLDEPDDDLDLEEGEEEEENEGEEGEGEEEQEGEPAAGRKAGRAGKNRPPRDA